MAVWMAVRRAAYSVELTVDRLAVHWGTQTTVRKVRQMGCLMEGCLEYLWAGMLAGMLELWTERTKVVHLVVHWVYH